MANVDRVFGFRPVNKFSTSAGWIRTFSKAVAYGTGLFIGDVVKLAGSSDIKGHLTIELAAAGSPSDVPVGVVVGVLTTLTDRDSITRTYSPADTADQIFVNCDPNLIMEVQGNASIAVADMGLNANLVQTSGGDTTSGASGQELNISSLAVTNSFIFNVVGISDREDNAFGVDCKILVRFNIHQYGMGVDVSGTPRGHLGIN